MVPLPALDTSTAPSTLCGLSESLGVGMASAPLLLSTGGGPVPELGGQVGGGFVGPAAPAAKALQRHPGIVALHVGFKAREARARQAAPLPTPSLRPAGFYAHAVLAAVPAGG